MQPIPGALPLARAVSPILVGRRDLLRLAEHRAAQVRAGRGHALFLAGEAGIGKTRLLGAIERLSGEAGFRVTRVAAFPGDVDVPGAPLQELARVLRRQADDAPLGAIATGLDERLGAGPVPGDLHRRRRLLVLDLAELVLGLGALGPFQLSIEDLHWADDLTVEVLDHVARSIDGVPLLLVATYRSDELFPRTRMREWRSRLVTGRRAEEARLGRLGREETAEMIAAIAAGRPVPTILVDAIHQRGDGIPLHTEELLSAARDDGSLAALPATLADAVIARLRSASRRSRQVASVAAVIGRSFQLDLLAECLDCSPDVLATPLRGLQDRFVIVPADDGQGYDFRHALIRDAIEADTSLPTRRRLHGLVADAIARRSSGADDAVLSAHYEMAGRRAEAVRHALRAARLASGMSAHREALALYRRVLANLADDTPAGDRASLLAELGTEATAVDDNMAASVALAEARAGLLDLGRWAAAAAVVPALVAARHLLGDDLAARVRLIEQGIADLDREPALDPADPIRARLVAARAAAYMLDRRLPEAIAHGEEAQRLARGSGDLVTALDIDATLGSCLVFAGRMDDGWTLLEATIERARAARPESSAARAYRMAGTSASVLVEYDRAERWLRDGIDFAERVELWNHRHYMTAHLGHVAWATGDWSTARSLAELSFADGRGGLTTRITALHVLGYVALGRGEWGPAAAALDEARSLAAEMAELQRFAPALWGLAELALLRGDAATALEHADRAREASAAVDDAAYLFPFLVTGTRAALLLGDPLRAERWVDDVEGRLRRVGIPGTLPAIPHARGLLALAAGQTARARRELEAAREGWLGARRTWEANWAALDLARCATRTNRRPEADRLAGEVALVADGLGAAPLAEAAARLVGTRDPSREAAPWAPLTAREFQVARLVASGLTDAGVAEELGLSPRTVGAHVAHILDKLGVERRVAIAAWVATVAGPDASLDPTPR